MADDKDHSVWIPMEDFLRTLPEPKTFKEKLIVFCSNLIDSAYLFIAEIKRKLKRMGL